MSRGKEFDMIVGIIVLILIATGLAILLAVEERSERRVDLASELQVPGSAQLRAAYDYAFRTRTWPVSTSDISRRQPRRVAADARRAA